MAKTKKKSLSELTLEELQAKHKGVATISNALLIIVGVLFLIGIGTIFYFDLEMKSAAPMMVAIIGAAIAQLPLFMSKKSIESEINKRTVS